MSTKPIFRQSDYNNLELVRQIVFDRLKNDSKWSQFDNDWDQHSTPWVEFENHNIRRRFVVLAHEVMWQLIIQGVLTVGSDSSNLNLPHFRITDYGHSVLEEERFIPHDPTGYLKDLKGIKRSILTKVAVTYVEEALRCFNSGCHVASVLLLGVAAESVFLQLCEVIQLHLKDNNEKKKLDNQLPVKTKHRWIVQKYQNLPAAVRRGKLPESLDMTLTSLYDLIRRQRNDLGHPQETPPLLNREQAFVFFKLFPGFAQDIQIFAKYCKNNGL